MKSNNSTEKMLNLFAFKLKELEQIPEAVWMYYGNAMPISRLNGIDYPGGSALLLDIAMKQKNFHLPIFDSFIQLRSNGIQLKPNVKGVPIPVTILTAEHIISHRKITALEYESLSASDKREYILLPNVKVQYVFNVEQTTAEKTHPELWNKWKERYAGAPPQFSPDLRGIMEFEKLVESQKCKFPNYFEAKPNTGNLSSYYCKCAQAISYIAFKSLPKDEQNYRFTRTEHLLLISEIVGASLCTKYGLKSFSNPNFMNRIHIIRDLISENNCLTYILGKSNQVDMIVKQSLQFGRDNAYYAAEAVKNLSEYIERSKEKIKAVLKPSISIKSIFNESPKSTIENEKPPGINMKR